jgi:LCP family protein required for cell wall assembly
MSANDSHGADGTFSTVARKRAPGRRRAERQHSWLGRHRVLVAVLMLGTLLLTACGGWAVYLNSKIADVPRVELDLDENRRPKKVGGEAAEAMNILLAGADAGGGPSIAEAVESGEWPPYSHRSDTIMILHVTADREKAYLVSVPRDTWTEIEGIGMSKINAAFALGGPSLYVQTLEEFTGLRMDHLAIIDWNGFKDLTTALGGIPVYIPEDVYDPSQDVQWEAGKQDLEGKRALQYVRMRYGLENGDFDRIKRQQNFLRQTLRKLLSNGTTSNPIRLTNAVEAITKYLTVDSEFSNSEIRSLALSLRSLDDEDVTFLTIPRKRYDTIEGQSVVIHDEKQTEDLFEAVANDNISDYIDEYGKEGVLGKQRTVR